MTEGRIATLQFDRTVPAPVETLWEVWTSPSARALWSAPSPDVTVEFLETTHGTEGREVSLCKVAGHPDVRVEARWLSLAPARHSVNSEVVSCEDVIMSAALVTANFTAAVTGQGDTSQIAVTVQLSSLAQDMADGYRHGFRGGLANLADVAGRTMCLTRTIKAPVATVWGAWVNPETLPLWWGPDGFSCATRRIDLRSGGEWVFDMIAPDGKVFPNHHRYTRIEPHRRIDYTLLWGENGPKHADAWIGFEDLSDETRITLCMAMATRAELETARSFGAEALGLQTLGKLARFVGTA